MTFLTESERADLKAQHRLERDRKICDRIKAVLLYDKGWSPAQIAEALLLTEGAIRHHIAEYEASKKLKPNSSGSNEKLSKDLAEKLERHLSDHIYLYVKDIAFYVKSKWNISYSIQGLTDWLKRHRFSYKKPCLVPGKANADKQREWIEKYNDLKANLLDTETICFTDGVHPTHNTQLAYGWIKKGVSKSVAANSGRSRINLTGSVDIISHKVVVQEDTTLNAEATIKFLTRLEAAYPEKTKVHVFCDNARYYRNKAVTEYLKNSKINLQFLPPYSPNLNPIERLWKWMKERVMYNTYYEEYESFRSAIIGFFDLLSGLDPGSELGSQFRRRVRDKFRILDAPI